MDRTTTGKMTGYMRMIRTFIGINMGTTATHQGFQDGIAMAQAGYEQLSALVLGLTGREKITPFRSLAARSNYSDQFIAGFTEQKRQRVIDDVKWFDIQHPGLRLLVPDVFCRHQLSDRDIDRAVQFIQAKRGEYVRYAQVWIDQLLVFLDRLRTIPADFRHGGLV